MADQNSIACTGRLGADPELQYTPDGKAVCRFRLAVGRAFTREGQPDTDWFTVTLWGKAGEAVAKNTAKGSRVAVAGEIEIRPWQDKATGAKRESVEIRATRVTFLDAKPQADAAPAPQEVAGGDDPFSSM